MLTAIMSLSLLVAFLLELAVLAAVGYWGFKAGPNLVTKLLAGIGTPILFAVAWGSSAPQASPSR